MTLMLGNTLLSVAETETALNTCDFSTLQKPAKNKGERGLRIEKELGINNSSRLIDLIDGELKSFTIGESIAVTQLSHCLPEIIQQSVEFDDSKVARKLSQVIYIGFTRSNEYVGNITINKDTHSEYYQYLAEDYGYISAMIRYFYLEGRELRTITGPNRFLQIRTKDYKTKRGTYTPLCYNDIQLKNKLMAFYHPSNFGRIIL